MEFLLFVSCYIGVGILMVIPGFRLSRRVKEKDGRPATLDDDWKSELVFIILIWPILVYAMIEEGLTTRREYRKKRRRENGPGWLERAIIRAGGYEG